MQSSFDRSLAAVLKEEGGYVNHADDPGGPTNKGITLANFRRFVDPKGEIADLKKLTTDQAAIVYRRQYWDAVSGSELPAGVDHAVFDFGVNSGPSRAIKFLQAVVGADEDGVIGPQTLAAVDRDQADVIVNALCDKRQAWLGRLGTFATFGKGWTARVKRVRALALELASGSPVAPEEAPGGVVVPTEPSKPASETPSQPAAPFRLDWVKVAAWLAAAVALFFALT